MKLILIALFATVVSPVALAESPLRPLSFSQGHALCANARLIGDEVVCDNGTNQTAATGWCWQLKLNQREASPFKVVAESLAEATPSGFNARDYSLYIDITYADKSHLYGQVAEFSPRPGLGWQRRSVTVCPDKPIKVANCYLLYRFRPGRVRFRAPSLQTFEGQAITLYDTWSQDLSALRLSPQPRFYLRDAAADRGFLPITPGGAPVEGVRLTVTQTNGSNGTAHFDVTLNETTAHDRAISLVYALPLPGADAVVWHDNPNRSESLSTTSGQRRATTNQQAGEGALSKWPFGAVTAAGQGLALGYDPSAPAIFRVTANAKTRELLIAFDVGFAREKSVARFRFVRFAFPGELGFRGALAAYQRVFPENHAVRLRRHGLWMPFHKISKVRGWEDFGFAVKEGDNEPGWDDAHDIVTFHYTEPTSWWMPMKGGFGKFTFEDCLAEAERRAAKGEHIAKAWKTSTYHDRDGLVTGSVRDTPWCVGAVWNLSPLPGIAGGEYEHKLTGPSWEKRYAHVPPQGVDGEYIDSAEPYMAPALDFNRAHFAAARTPLAYDPETKRPAVAKCLAVYEYVRTTADRCHATGRYLMGNGIPYSWPWLVPFSDFGGQETKWIDKKGTWKPMSADDLLYRRALSGAKPYCFLMNVNFDLFPPALVEKYMQRSLAYGLCPGFFSPNASGGHYFSRPELYDRDRPLFKKYVPLCRLVSEAGWRPVNTLVKFDPNGISVEQFGDRYLTVFNPGQEPLAIRLDFLQPTSAVRELVTGENLAVSGNRLELTLPAETARLIDR